MNPIRQSWRKPRILLCATAILISRLSLSALDPHQPLAQLYHSSWNAQQGVNGNVTALAQTRDGYLWVGTSDGLLRFDGISFERYQPESGSLMAASVSALMAVPDGGLWVGFDRGGASFIRNGQVTNYSDTEGFPVSTVHCFARDRSGAVWAAAVGGFARFDGRRWQTIDNAWNYPANTAWRILVDRDGTLWAATGNKILFLPEGTHRFQSAGIRSGKVSVLMQAPDGAIVFYDDEHRKLRAFRHDKSGKIEMLRDIDISASSAAFDRDGALWVGGDGLSRLTSPFEVRGESSQPAIEKFTESEGLSNQHVEAILEDREGNLWTGTDGGLDRFRHRNVQWFPLRGNSFSLVAGPNGEVWAGSRGSSFPLVRARDQKPVAGGPTDVYTAYRDPDGTLWFSGDRTLVHWQNGRFSKVAVPEQVEKLNRSATPPNPTIASAITSDRSGALWVAFGGSGEFRLKDGVWTFVPILPGHPDWSAGYSFTDNEDRIWLYWGDRIAEYDHGKVQIYGSDEGLAIGPPNAMAEHNQLVWAGGESGLAFLEGGRFHKVESVEPRGFSSIIGLVATRTDGIWLGTAAGIVHIPENEIETVVQHPDHKVAFELFDQISDTPDPIQRGVVYAPEAIQARDGGIWFAARDGAILIDPANIYRNPVPPPVSIRSILADGKSYSAFSRLALPPLTRNLRIEYAGLSLSIPERVRFRYRLDGQDKEWQDAGTRREAVYTNLGPGSYRFHVIACNNSGVWNEAGETLDFSIAPAYWQTNFFRALCVFMFLAILWTAYHLRVRAFAQRQALLERHRTEIRALNEQMIKAQEAERMRIAGELHDSILQQITALVLKLGKVKREVPPDSKSLKTVAGLQKDLIQVGTDIRHVSHKLHPMLLQESGLPVALSAYCEEFSSVRGIPVSCVAEKSVAEMSPGAALCLYRIAQEALGNAAKYSRAGHVEVRLSRFNGQVELSVADDGVGCAPEQIATSGGLGVINMRERVLQLNGTFEFDSQPGRGTRVNVTIPFREPS